MTNEDVRFNMGGKIGDIARDMTMTAVVGASLLLFGIIIASDHAFAQRHDAAGISTVA